MLGSKKAERLEQEVEDLHRRLAEKDKEIANQVCVIMAQKREYESLKVAYDALLNQNRQLSACLSKSNETQLVETNTL